MVIIVVVISVVVISLLSVRLVTLFETWFKNDYVVFCIYYLVFFNLYFVFLICILYFCIFALGLPCHAVCNLINENFIIFHVWALPNQDLGFYDHFLGTSMISAMNLTREAKTLSTKLVSKVIFCAVLDPIPYIYHATYSTTVLDPSMDC